MGRWTSPDWSASPEPVPYAKPEDPQTLNLYGYLRNTPLNTIDPDGHADKCGVDKGPNCVTVHTETTKVNEASTAAADGPYVAGQKKVNGTEVT